MQGGSATTATSSGTNTWSSSLPSMYPNPSQPSAVQGQGQQPNQQTQQRNPSNPRTYPAADPNAIAGERRTDSLPYPPQPGGHQYPQYGQQAGYSGGYQYDATAMGAYPTASSASGPSGTRRTSGTKTTTPPTASNSSPANRYYAGQDPSYPTSAPPQVTSHSQQPMGQPGQQPMTAHPHGGGYYPNYYNSEYQYYPGYQQPSSSRPTGQGHSATTPTTAVPATATADAQRSSSGSYDYSSPNLYTPHSQYPQWSQGRGSTMGQSTSYPVGAWPNPTLHGQSYPVHHGQYPIQQYPGYYGAMNQNYTSVVPPHRKGKKDNRDEYIKRPSAELEGIPPYDVKAKGGKKKPEEKPVPKPPAKSHLNPPRQAQSMWQLFFTDELNKAKAAAITTSPGGTETHAKLNVAQIAKDAGLAYNTLDGEQRKYYAGKVEESKKEYARLREIWDASLTPEDVRMENVFRAQQRKEGKSRKGNLKDPNAPKKPLSAYFLFLKGIRENDELRAKVWAKESETTKQSVLAAERWRSLSDDEKRPFLQQAEKDKQDYEAARKIYENEAAAKARGENFTKQTDPSAAASKVVPPIPISAIESGQMMIDTDQHVAAPPTPRGDHQTPVLESGTSPDFGQYTRDSEDPPASDTFDTSMDDFQYTHDPLVDMDLVGLAGMTDGEQTQQWDISNLMGEATNGKATDNDVDVAPSMAEAVAETSELPSSPIAKTESAIQDVAASAEGSMSVPDVGPVEQNASGIPTEESSDMPLYDAPATEEQVPVKAESGLASPLAVDGTRPFYAGSNSPSNDA